MRHMTLRQEAVLIAAVAATIVVVGWLSQSLLDRHLQYRAGAVAVVIAGLVHVAWRRWRHA